MPKIAGKRILITGGAGFVGYHLAGYLSARDAYKIDIADNLSRGKFDLDLRNLIQKSNITFKKIDLTAPASYKSLDRDYDYIYHLAGIVGVRNVTRRPDRTLFVNTVSILNLLDWVSRTQRGLKRFVFASTSEIYSGTMKHCGMPVPTGEDVMLCLEDIRSPRTTYALSKMVGESACFSYFKIHGIPFTIVRYHNVYGPRMGDDHVIPELMLKAGKGRGYLEVFSPGHTRSFCYISDAVRATADLAEAKNSSGQIFNVGNSDEEIKIKDLAGKIIRIVNPSLKIKSLGDQEGSPSRRCPEIDKLRRAVGFRPAVSLDDGIKLTRDWYREHRQAN